MADRYWIEKTQNFLDIANWSEGTGGAGGASVPATGDTAIFDENSFSGDGYVFIETEVLCHISIVVGVRDFFFWIKSGGILSLQEDLIGLNGLIVAGDFITNNYNVTLGDWFSAGATGNINLGTSTLTINNSSGAGGLDIYSGATLDVDEAIIIINDSLSTLESKVNFNAPGVVFGSVQINFTGGFACSFGGSNSFNPLSITGDGTVLFNSWDGIETTQTLLGTTVLTGATSGGLILDGYESSGWVLSKASGMISAENCTFLNMVAAGGATFNAFTSNGCVDGGGNSGWNFTEPEEDEEDNVSYQDITSRLIPFVFSVSDAFALEFGNYYIRFIHNRAQITKTYATWETATSYLVGELVEDSGSYYRCLENHTSDTFATDLSDGKWVETEGTTDLVYEIPSPYTTADVKTIKYCQSADVLYLFHPDYPTQKLSRLTDDKWQLNEVNFRPPPTREVIIEPTATLTPGATTGEGITFTTNTGVFLEGDEGKIIKSEAGKATITTISPAAISTVAVCDILDDFGSTSPIEAGDWELQGSPGETVDNRLLIIGGGKHNRVVTPAGGVGTWLTDLYTFRPTDVGKYIYANSGCAKIIKYNSPISVQVEILQQVSSNGFAATWKLEESIFNETNGYPSCGVFYEDRLVVSGVPGFPENIRGSKVGDYENFTAGILDDDSYDLSISGRLINSIKWIEPREYLILGSTGAEWRLGPEDSGAAMTPLNVVAKQQTNFGCADIDPLTVKNCTLFVQRALRKIREFTNNPTSLNIEYVAPDLTTMAEHITAGKIAGMCYQQEPLSVVWVWMENGELASMTYQRDEDVIGWARHPISGTVESMCSIPADGYDEVYAIIKRTLNGQVVRSIEVLEKLFTDDSDTFDENNGLNAFFVDCGITYNYLPATVITGLSHLEGEEVSIVADGAVKDSQIVSGGQITLTTAASVVHAGLAYTGKMQTMRPEIALQDGTTQGRMKRIINLIVRVLNSGTFKAGRDEINLDEYGFATYVREVYATLFRNSDVPTGTPASLFTGDKKVIFDGDFNRDARLTIIQDKPLPLTVVAIAAEMEIIS